MRDLARRAGVSHAAPAHHFGDKAGLLTAVAVEGFDLFADALNATWERTGDFTEVGVAYVRFGLTHRGHFEVMFQPALCRTDSADLTAARARAAEALRSGAALLAARAEDGDQQIATLAAWSLVHGFTGSRHYRSAARSRSRRMPTRRAWRGRSPGSSSGRASSARGGGHRGGGAGTAQPGARAIPSNAGCHRVTVVEVAARSRFP
ncbi:TetR/AcrR family transcriptional regulator [Streptomyces sp. AB3(2024)]|uniref:TetR/AcrR family transcriptional regulator n=1 Tax=Streptomyces sp. AB3(2024) TaxID=3317321 RepID=UPI0035A2C6B7